MNGTTPTIVYVSETPAPSSQYWDQRLERSGLKVERIPTVHLALARLGRGMVGPAAIVVRADSLDPSEFEFFELVSRYHRGTAVYVCGCSEARHKLDAALAAGARDVLTAERFEKLVGELEGRLERPRAGVNPAEHGEANRALLGTSESAAASSIGAEPSTGEAPARLAEAADPAGDAADPVRVRFPWRQSAGGPVRTPPAGRRRRAPTGPADPAGPAAKDRNTRDQEEAELFDGPLLSPEELALLMDNDSSARPAPGDQVEEDAR